MSTKITSLINKIKDTLIFDKHSSLRKKLSYILKNNDKKFYDYGEGYFYQSCEKIKVSGLRDTKFRINCLDLINLTENKEILDIGCNSGFFLIDLYNNYKKAIGIEYNNVLIEVANITKEYLKIDNIDFICEDFLKKEFHESKFDIIFSLANHSTFDKGIENTREYFLKVFSLLKEGGILVFESHHPQYENNEKFNKIKESLLKLFTIEKEGKYETKNFYDNGRKYLFLKTKENFLKNYTNYNL